LPLERALQALGTPNARRNLLRKIVAEAPCPELQKGLEDAIASYERQATWNIDFFGAFADIPKSRIFLALREGRIKAFGKKYPLAIAIAGYSDSESDTVQHVGENLPWEPIPADSWLLASIDWSWCSARCRDAEYHLILVDTESLLAAFPLPSDPPVIQVDRIGDSFVLRATFSDEYAPAPRQKVGRPPLPWDQFHLEMTRRVKNGTLDPKQEATIADMQDWCLKRWGQKPARSTLLVKISPYYDEFVRPKG